MTAEATEIRSDRPTEAGQLDRLFHLSLDLLGTVGFDGYFKQFNAAWTKTLGFSTEELLARPAVEFIHPEDRAATLAAFQPFGETVCFENRYLCKDGSYKWLAWKVTPSLEERILYIVARDLSDDRQPIETALYQKIAQLEAEVTMRSQTELALRERESRLNSILNCLKDVVWSVQFEANDVFKVIFLNPAVEQLYGRPYQDFIERPQLWLEAIAPEDRDLAFQHSQKVLAEGSGEIEYRIVRPDGSVRWVQVRSWLIDSEAEHIIRMDGIVIDISDRKQAERAQARLTAILEATPDFVGIADASGRSLYVNKAGRQIVGIPETEDITALSIPDFMGHSVLDFVLTVGWQTVVQKGVWTGETALQHRDGREIPVSQVWMAHYAESGEVEYFSTIIRNITERKQAELALQESETRYRRIVETSTEGIWELDTEGNTRLVNPQMAQMLGYAADEMIGQSLFAFMDDQGKAIAAENLERRRQGISEQHDFKFMRKDGSALWAIVSASPIIDRTGHNTGTLGMITDITERKLAEDALAERASLAAFRADVDIALTQSDSLQRILQRCSEAVVQHLDAAFARIWTLNAQENVLELQASAGMYTHLDGPHSRVLVGQFKIGLIALEQKPHLTNSALDDPRVGNKVWAKQEGMVAFAGYPLIVDNQLVGVIAMFARQPLKDSTLKALECAADEIGLGIKRKQAEEALRDSEARFRQLAQREALLNQLASQIRNSLNVDTILETVVQEIRKLLQIDRCLFVWYRTSVETPIWDVVKEAKTDTLPSFLGSFPAPTNRVTQTLANLAVLRVDDLSQMAEPALQELYQVGGYRALLATSFQTSSGDIGVLSCNHHCESKVWSDAEVELLQATCDQMAIALFQADLYTQAQTAALQAQEKAQQLEQALHQLQQTQAQLIQTEKMSSLGQLVAGVAHEINNPVNFIYGNLTHADDYIQDLLDLIDLYQQHYPHPSIDIEEKAEAIDLEFLIEDLPKLLDSMKMGADRIRQIVLSLRNFSRLDEAEMKAVDIHEGIENTLLILHNRLKARSDQSPIEIIREYDRLPLVECYPGQLNQVFMNLLNNALDALETQAQPKRITIRTSITGGETNQTAITRAQTSLNSYVVIQIIDNGPGMSEATQARLFDPFFTTKPVGKGTGLGLSISYQIVVEKHKGSLTCNSQLGQGSEFVVKIPITQNIRD